MAGELASPSTRLVKKVFDKPGSRCESGGSLSPSKKLGELEPLHLLLRKCQSCLKNSFSVLWHFRKSRIVS